MTEKRAHAARLVHWLRTEVGDKAITGRALADVFDSFLAAMDEDRAGLVDEMISATGRTIKDATIGLTDRLEQIDGAALLKSAGAAVTAANMRALDGAASDVELRKARLISGTPSAFLRQVLDGDQASGKEKAPDIIFRKTTVTT